MVQTRARTAAVAAATAVGKLSDELSEYEGFNEDEDFDFNEDQDYPELQATWEATFIEKTFAAYCSWVGGRKSSIRKQLPSTQVLWETPLPLEYHTSTPSATLDALKSLPEFSYADEPAWTVYLLILEHPEHPPMVYVGSGTDMKKGTHKRFKDYDRNYQLSSLTAIARKNGHHISNKKILMSAQCPEAYLVLPGRALFLIVETAMSHALCAYEDKSILDTNLTNHQWGLAEYEGLCSHHSWYEGLRFGDWFTEGLSKSELSAALARSSAKRLAQRLAKRNDKKEDVILASRARWQSIKEDPVKHAKHIAMTKRWRDANREHLNAKERRRRLKLKADPVKYRQHLDRRNQVYHQNKDRSNARAREYRAANKDKVTASERQYAAANRDKMNASQRRYAAANKDKINASKRRYAAANRDKINARAREYRAANKDKVTASKRRWAAANRDKISVAKKKSRASSGLDGKDSRGVVREGGG